MQSIRYGKGRSSVEITGELRKFVEQAIRSANPEITEAMEDLLEEVQGKARREWPVRRLRSGAIDSRSQDSKNQIEIGFRIIPPNTLEGFILNSAPYAWAIKSGDRSVTSVPKGKRVADILLWKPIRTKADKLGKEIANRILKRARR